jgi:hypothetical protein
MAGKYVYVKAKPKNTVQQAGHWSEKKKNEALTLHVACGNMLQVARETGVPYRTIQEWAKSQWWKDRVKDIQNEEYDRLDSRLSKALDKALDSVMDRIESGETMYDPKTGKLRKVPAKLRDLNTAMSTLLDKRQLIRKQPTKIVEQTSTAAQLQNLAQQFASFVSGQKPKEDIKDIVDEFILGENVVQADDGSYHLDLSNNAKETT